MSEFKSPLAEQFEAFVRFRKACMKWNDTSYGMNLLLFDKHCLQHFPEEKVLTQDMVDSWCNQRESESNNGCISRIYAIVSLVRFLRGRGLTNANEPVIPSAEKRLYIPHPFTKKELQLFFRACDSYKPFNFRTASHLNIKYTLPVFFRLLYSTGMRTTEARKLRRCNVNLDTGVISIVNTKGYEQHYVVMHDSMLVLMKTYDSVIEDLYPGRMYFFPNGMTGFRSRAWVQHYFKIMWEQVGSTYAIAYELRHNYATENINKLVGQGMSFEDNLIYLSKSMGHTSADITVKYYYSLVPALSEVLLEQTETGFNELIPEVDYEEG